MMKLGIIGSPIEESFQKAKEKDLDFLEFCISVGTEVESFVEQVDDLREWIETYGVGVQSIGRWGTDRIDENGELIEKELNDSYKLIDAASALDCENLDRKSDV